MIEDGKIRVVSGVSCESCHGAGADWIEVHNQYGEDRDHASEPAEHRRLRIERSRAAGMRRPSDLYPVAANCFSCHTVPLERLVNVGGHTTGSSDFELVAWSQGDIRHNFLDSFLSGDGTVNRERPASRKRLLYVVGRALDLEYSLRGVAKASGDGVYAKAMIRRVRSAVAELRAIARTVEIEQVAAMLRAVAAVEARPGNEQALVSAADAVGRATRDFLDVAAPARLAALDPLVEGTAPDAPPPAPAPAVAAAGPAPPAGSEAEPGSAAGADPAAGPAAAPAAAARGPEGAFKRRIRPAAAHRTLGPAACSGCHTEQNNWWFGHAHFRAADPFFDGAPKNLQIARLYGVSPAQMTTGSHVCMDCHGTIVNGKESRDVLDGVGCESCHGAAGDWLEPHKNEADKELGRRRPGHLAALAAGKRDLRQARLRTETCAGCHYVTDVRLLSAGHPSGVDFDYVRGMAEIRHWQHRLGDGEITAAAAAVLDARGGVPRVRLAAAATAPPGEAPRNRATAGAPPRTGGSAADRRRAEAFVLRPPAPRPVSGRGAAAAPAAGAGGLELPPLPELGAASIEETLLAVKQRLELLYRLVAGGRDGGS